MPISVPIKICIFIGLIAKRLAYGRSGLATSAMLLAPKKNQQNYNWQRYTQQPKQCAASQSHCLSPSSLMCRGKHPGGSRARSKVKPTPMSARGCRTRELVASVLNAAIAVTISLSGKEYRSAIGHPNCDSPPPKHVRNRNGQFRVQKENTAAMWRKGLTASPLCYLALRRSGVPRSSTTRTKQYGNYGRFL